ncbi:hypothetical protein [uncultured Fibrobacter sp.]|uniref:hypothetical protein n=1 Tax=uncultured Fibrobacter sp. TaxID=261512 RepID=UPI0025EB73CC|nr:hypothetical protein [uncultured Fibrobacter sp.]
MKIEKKKVVKNSKLSRFTKSAVAAALGIAASIGTTACDDSMSATSGDHPKQPETNPTCGQAACGEQYSSSSYTDISSSGEHLSSEAIEALSSAMQPLSSSSMVYPPPESGSPMADSESSMSSERLSSSSYEPPPEAGILPPYEESSSSEMLSSSSIVEPEPLAGDPIIQESSSSESTPGIQSSSSDIKVPVPQITPVIDTINPRIHLCEDPNNPGCLIESMVTTFEQSDIQV